MVDGDVVCEIAIRVGSLHAFISRTKVISHASHTNRVMSNMTFFFFSFWVKITFEVLLPCCLTSSARVHMYHTAISSMAMPSSRYLCVSVNISEWYYVCDVRDRPRSYELHWLWVNALICMYLPTGYGKRLLLIFCFGKSAVGWPDKTEIIYSAFVRRMEIKMYPANTDASTCVPCARMSGARSDETVHLSWWLLFYFILANYHYC